jgi:TolA-binding protein
MTSPSRREPQEKDVRRALLDSARHDAPTAQAIRRTRTAVLLAMTTAASTTAATAMSTTAARWITMLKWLGVGTLGGLTTVGAIHVASHHAQSGAVSMQPQLPKGADQTATPRSPLSAVSGFPIAQSAPPPSAPDPSVTEHAAPAPSQQSESRPAGPSLLETPPAPAPAASSSAGASLAQEVAMLDEARRALAQGRAGEALAALDRYRRDYPSGRLGQEATFVRIQALSMQGNTAAARSVAEQFLQTSPTSPLADRVRAVLKQGAPEGSATGAQAPGTLR